MPCRPFIVVLGALFGALPALAHEFWVYPHEFQVKSNTTLSADLKVGENFEGPAQAYFQTRTERFELHLAGRAIPFQGRMGDVPALTIELEDEGLLLIVHQTKSASLKYHEWADFQAFADHKGFADIRARHLARDLPETGFRENYWRYAKALVGVGHSSGHDREVGMETEFVALANPYTADMDLGLPVQLLYQDAPRPGAQVEVFDRAPDGTVRVTTAQTDAKGIALIPVSPGHEYLLDAVFLRPAPDLDEAVWESHWASITFKIP